MPSPLNHAVKFPLSWASLPEGGLEDVLEASLFSYFCYWETCSVTDRVPRNLSNAVFFFLSSCQVSQCWSAVNSGIQWLSIAGLILRWKRWRTLSVRCASLTVAKIKSIVSFAAECCLQKQGKASPCSNRFETAEKITLEIFLVGCTRYLRLQLCWFAFVF